MTTDLREHQRESILHLQNGGEFEINIKGVQYKINAVENVSVTGACISLPNSYPKHTPTQLTYSAPDCYVTINGQVIWSKESDESGSTEEQGYQIGIQFDSRTIEENRLLFLALRRQLAIFS